LGPPIPFILIPDSLHTYKRCLAYFFICGGQSYECVLTPPIEPWQFRGRIRMVMVIVGCKFCPQTQTTYTHIKSIILYNPGAVVRNIHFTYMIYITLGGPAQSSRPGFKAPAQEFRNRAGTHLTRLARRKAKNPKAKAAILAMTIFCPLAHQYFRFEYRLL
jgi:hypothetical protein